MTEIQLQSGIAVEFSQQYPNKRGQLFHVANERNNKIQAFRSKAIGIVNGVADFVFFDTKFNVATELKAPNTRHKVAQIRKQIEWGKIWENQGSKRKPNIWRLCMTIEEAINCYNGNFQGMTIKEVEKKLNSVSTLTIKF